LIHHLISFEFVCEPRGISFVMEVINNEATFSMDFSFRLFQLPMAVAALAIEDVAGVAGRVDPQKNGRLGSLDLTFVNERVFGAHTTVPGFDRSHHEAQPVTGGKWDIENRVDQLIPGCDLSGA
jgi:hypothetical protein